MIWGYPYFWKHPYQTFAERFMLCQGTSLHLARCHRRSLELMEAQEGQKQFMRTWTQEKHQEWINKSNFDLKVHTLMDTWNSQVPNKEVTQYRSQQTCTSLWKHCASHFQIPVGMKTCTGQGICNGNHIATVANNKIWSHKNGRAVLSSQFAGGLGFRKLKGKKTLGKLWEANKNIWFDGQETQWTSRYEDV